MTDRIMKWAGNATIGTTAPMAAATIGGASARLANGTVSQNELTVWAGMAVATVTLAICIIVVRAARRAGR